MSKDIKSILWELIGIYRRSHGAGHTHAMLKGVENTEQCKVACLTYDHGVRLGLKPKKILTLDNPDKLKGLSACLAFDNLTLLNIFERCAEKIASLERELESYKPKKPDLSLIK